MSIYCLISFHIFRHWTADAKKNINPTSPDYEKRCDTCSTELGSGGLSSPNSQSILPQTQTTTLVSPIKSFSYLFYTAMNPPQTRLKPPNAVDLAMDMPLSRIVNTGNNQPITNSKIATVIQHHSHQ